MQRFITKYHDRIVGAVSGFDRVQFRGTLRRISSLQGLSTYLAYMGVLLKHFGEWSMSLTARIRQASEAIAAQTGRPLHYVGSSAVRKEDFARSIAQRDGIHHGLICVLTAVEPCMSFDVRRNRERKRIELVARERKCLWVYHYLMHPQLGFMHARLQTWVPFTIKICINGREWLAQQLQHAGIGFLRKRNCFIDVADMAGTQRLAWQQLRTNWPHLLDSIAAHVNPVHRELFHDYPLPYYWSADETEWATDMLFGSADDLSLLYPSLLRQAITTFGSDDVMRFLGQIHPLQRSHPNFKGQVVSDIRRRPEGLCIKHRLNANSVKMYNKEGSVLRVETTINNARQFKVYRPSEDKPRGRPRWLRMRKGVADLHRRARVSQACNERYIDALATLDTDTPLAHLVHPLCRSLRDHGRRYRALSPFAQNDRELLAAVCRPEFLINGLRNRELRCLLYPNSQAGALADRRRAAGRVTRMLGILRAHGILKKVPKTHRYLLTDRGRQITTLLSLAANATPCQLARLAA